MSGTNQINLYPPEEFIPNFFSPFIEEEQNKYNLVLNELISTTKQITNKDVVFVSNINQKKNYPFLLAYTPLYQTSNKIIINTNSTLFKNPPLAIMHELYHWLAATDEEKEFPNLLLDEWIHSDTIFNKASLSSGVFFSSPIKLSLNKIPEFYRDPDNALKNTWQREKEVATLREFFFKPNNILPQRLFNNIKPYLDLLIPTIQKTKEFT